MGTWGWSRSVVVLLLLLSLGLVACSTVEVRGVRPNIVLVLVDDLGCGDLGCYHPSSKIPTPNLDKLAKQSVVCTDAHSPSSVCTPTRYAVLTGRYAWRTRLRKGVLQGYDRLLIEPGRETIPSMLQDAGYRTACIGKWHLGLGSYEVGETGRTDYTQSFDAGPHTVGFETTFAIPASLDMPPYVYVVGDDLEEPATAQTPGSKRRWSGGGGFWRKGAMAPSFDFYQVVPRCVEQAERFVRECAADRSQPFFLYLPLPTPHTPWMPTLPYQGRSQAGWYGDFVHQLDAEMGSLLAVLEEAGLAEDTLVIFTSDNGAHWRPRDVEKHGHDSHVGLRGMKADIHEAGHRVPLLVRWPDRLDPGTCADLIGLQDWYATIAAIVGEPIGPREGEDSLDQLPALLGDGAVRQEQVHHSLDGMFALRSGDWKWIEGRGSGGFTQPRRHKQSPGAAPGQLFDLAEDRAEQVDLVLERPEVVEQMRGRLFEIRQQ